MARCCHWSYFTSDTGVWYVFCSLTSEAYQRSHINEMIAVGSASPPVLPLGTSTFLFLFFLLFESGISSFFLLLFNNPIHAYPRTVLGRYDTTQHAIHSNPIGQTTPEKDIDGPAKKEPKRGGLYRLPRDLQDLICLMSCSKT